MKRVSYKKLKEKAWAVFSVFIRKRDNGICYTCGKQEPDYEDAHGNFKPGWKRMQAGHFKHRRLDFDGRNIHCQCKRCNGKWALRGNLDVYAEKLEEQYGYGIIQTLKELANTRTYSREELEQIIEVYSEKG